jgi:bacterioferritin (cytochrome b1)
VTREDWTLIDNLNRDLAGALRAIIQRITYAAKAKGRHGQRLTQFFLAGIPDQQAHAQSLAKEVVALGGEPTTLARAVPLATTNREMLEAVLATQQQAVQDYAGRVTEARECGHQALAKKLEDMVREEEVHAARTQRILRDWRLQS